MKLPPGATGFGPPPGARTDLGELLFNFWD